MNRILRTLPAVLVLAVVAIACTSDETPRPAQTETARRSPERAADGAVAILTIRRRLPEGPLFVEGSAAHARVADASGKVVLDEYFDVPRVPSSSYMFPRRLRAELPPGDYQLAIHQRPCDASACSGGHPKEWDAATLRCAIRLHLSADQRFTATAVVRSGGCRIAQRSHAG